ncbi:MAG: PP2C family protein-serine/threonine phosphatase [Pseudanabaenaceae cyanobacterium]
MWHFKLPTGNFIYSSAGHDNPILIRDCTVEFLPLETGILLGLGADNVFPIFETTLQPRDIVLLYTHGLTEAMNPQEEFFTDTRLLKDHLPTTTTIQTLEVVEQGHREFIQDVEQSDDLTLLLSAIADSS